MTYTLTAGSLTLELDPQGRAIALRHRQSGFDFLADQPHPVGLWQMGLIRPVAYRDPLPPVAIPTTAYDGHEWWANRDEYRADLELDADAAPPPAITASDSALALAWRVPLPDGAASVELRIAADGDRLVFGFSVVLPDSWAIKRATYPRIRGFGSLTAPEDDALLFPETWGVLRRNPLADMTSYQGQYPAHINWCQMTAWLHGDRGLYLGILDPDSHHTGIDMQVADGAAPVPLENNRRYLHLTGDGFQPDYRSAPAPSPLAARLANGEQPTMQLRCHHWPPMGAVWQAPYPVVLQAFTGTWYDAAKLHRQWARQQRWCRRGRLAERVDASPTLAGHDLWFIQYGFPPGAKEPSPAFDFQRRMHALRDYFGMPFGIHWYHWHNFSWHSRFPAHSPPVEGFAEVVRDLQARDIAVMPYCQGRLLYRDRPDWERERAHASVEANGQPYLEMYTPSDDWPLALCPADRWSQEQWREAARMLWQDYGVDGVYFDQITAMNPSLCYHAGHGHAPGGGNQYWRGYDDALASMAPMVRENPARFLSSELMADAFLDRIDLYLSFVPPLEDFVPLHPAIYGGYTSVMGRHTPDAVLRDPQLFAICQGEQLLFGGQLGWVNDGILCIPAAAAYLRDLARLRAPLRPFLHLGELEEPLTLAQEARLVLTLPPTFTTKGPVLLNRPAVRHTVWRAPDGRRLVLLLNQATSAANVAFAVPDDWPRGDWQLRRLGDDTVQPFTVTGTVNLDIPALGVVALIG